MGGFVVIDQILPILSLLLGGGIATIVTLKATKRQSEAQADQAEVQTQSDEFHLLKEQIELNQQQNLDLTKLNLELVERIKDKERRFGEQTSLLRDVQNKLAIANEHELTLTKKMGDLNVLLAERRCDTLECPFRQPPNAYTPKKQNE